MKKILVLAVLGLMTMAFAASLVSAATPHRGYYTGNQATLTEAQQQELKPLYDQLINIKQQIMEKLVADGVMTQADADQHSAWMKEDVTYRSENGMIGGCNYGGHGAQGRHGGGMRHNW